MWHWGWKLSNNFCNFLFALIQPGQAAGLVFQRGLHRSWCLTQSTLIFFHCRNCWSGKKRRAYGSLHTLEVNTTLPIRLFLERKQLMSLHCCWWVLSSIIRDTKENNSLSVTAYSTLKVIVGAYKVDRNIRGYFIYMTGILFCAWKAKGCVPST